MPSYCELTNQQEREVLGDEAFLETLLIHHLGAELSGIKGSDASLKFVAEEGDGVCHRTGRAALGFCYKDNPDSAYVRADQPRDQRLHVALHELRHYWQFTTGAPLPTTEGQEADAEGFARHYTPKLRPILGDATRSAAAMLARRAIDAPPSHLAVRSELDELAETVVDELGLERADEALFVDDPAQVRTSPTVEELVSRVTERVLDRRDVTVNKSGCGCGCGG